VARVTEVAAETGRDWQVLPLRVDSEGARLDPA
jgi:hypothetical protein